MDSTNGLEECLNSPKSMGGIPQKTTSPGILVFSRTKQLLHVNRRALELTGHIGQVERGAVNFVLSTSVSELRADVLEGLDSRAEEGIGEQFEVWRMVCERGQRMLLRGFGLPNPNSHDHSRIVLLLEELLDVRQEEMIEQAKEQSPPAIFVGSCPPGPMERKVA